ncbi:peptidylprolyl isomerase [Candidatus Paracaedibacter symbiosus]|uniref:peptidylprolyl isomerase n=1 Tax=Candidatus Paracaedibacter symbiosus TaxID=244582 RepID=UPI000509DAC7|nr:SurA N-terminal domain-containing protein [Candidatus Paracaedibacter symbiosus]
MRLKNFTIAILLQFLCVGNTFAFPAAATSKIIVIVNKDPISQSDLDNRVKLITLMSGMSAQKQDMENMRNQALQSLIQEKVQIHAAKNKKINVSDDEVNQTIQAMAQNNGMSDEQFSDILRSNGIPKETLATRIKAQMYWVKYIRQEYPLSPDVSDKDIDKALEKMENAKNQTQYLVSEIMLLVSSPRQEGSVLNDAHKLVADLKAGANFGMLAQQLSKDSSAASGGDLDWVTMEEIDPAIASSLRKLKPEEISPPIRTPAGFKIIKLRKIRQAGEADPNEAKITFCQVFLPETPTSSYEESAAFLEELMNVKGCDSFKSKAKSFNIDYKYNSNIKMGELPEQLQGLLKSASLGKCLEPIPTEKGLLVQMVCDYKKAESGLPDRNHVRAQLEQQKMSKHAALELRRLLSVAYLDFKDPKYASVVK